MKRRKKRITFLRLAVPAVLLAFMASFAFAFGLREYLWKDIQNKTRTYLNEQVSSAMSKISQLNEKDIDTIAQMDSWLSVYTQYCIEFNDYSYKYDSMLVSNITDNCYAVSAIIDKDNNIVASNKEKLTLILKSDENEAAYWYSCDKERFNIPQLNELFDYYTEIRRDHIVTGSYDLTFDSIYVNKEDCSFIPHKCSIELLKNTDDPTDGNVLGQYETVETREFVIETDDENYELIVLNQPPSKEAPRAFLCGIDGIEKNIFDEVMAYVSFAGDRITSGGFCHEINGKNLFCANSQNTVYINGEIYNLYTLFIVDDNAEIVMQLWRKCAVIFTLIALAIALLLSWRQNVVNKSRYAFEDYQKVLINNLAHDMKTPLTAIGGYAENAKKSVEKGNPEQTAMFLDAIFENVFYTDTIVNRTLELNHLNEIREVKKEIVRLHEIAEKSLEKYSVMLDEKRIDVELNGEFEISADKSMIETAIENLISNAVKFTNENGKISIIANKKAFTITNTTAEQVDIKDLKMPFVRGDKSRSEKTSGLGLSIVQSTAELNHLKFVISSTENSFKAVLKK